MWSLLLLMAVMGSLFLCLLLKKEVKCSQMESYPLTLEAEWLKPVLVVKKRFREKELKRPANKLNKLKI